MEVEIKYYLQDGNFDSVIQRLNDLGAIFVREIDEIDHYFKVVGRDSIVTKECLRIRETGEKIELTYKPASDDPNEKIFAKQESNVLVSDAQKTVELLKVLGNQLLVTVKKRRKYYNYNDCVVTLDFIEKVGYFLEIECEDEDSEKGTKRLNECADKLKLKNCTITNKPYRDIVLEAQTS